MTPTSPASLEALGERLRADAESHSAASKMIADAKSARNQANGEPDASYDWLRPEQTNPAKAWAVICELREENNNLHANFELLVKKAAERANVYQGEIAAITAKVKVLEDGLRDAGDSLWHHGANQAAYRVDALLSQPQQPEEKGT